MGKFLNTSINYFTLTLFVGLFLVVHQPVGAGQTKVETAVPPSTTSSAVVNVLARQIAFVKTFSTDFPYQYERESGRKESGRAGHNTDK
jgi:hypothetical protein